jgi:hypothetical protein
LHPAREVQPRGILASQQAEIDFMKAGLEGKSATLSPDVP